jgi:NADP-reducing hydrogenase subunit HndB
MKTLEDLNAIREAVRPGMSVRKEDCMNTTRVVVGMATCGIAAGARPVLTALVDETARRKLENVSVSQTGCTGICQFEPVIEVFAPGQEKVTYVKIDEDKARQIVSEHLVNNRVVTEYTIGSAQQGGRQ